MRGAALSLLALAGVVSALTPLEKKIAEHATAPADRELLAASSQTSVSSSSEAPSKIDLFLGQTWISSFTVPPGEPYWSRWQYYRWNLWGPNAHGMQVFVSQLAGDPDLFCSVEAQIPFPTNSNYNWSSITVFSESLIIYDNQPSVCPTYPCAIVCGVTPWLNKNTTYAIVAEKNGEPLALSDGAPFNAVVNTLQSIQFNFTEWVPTSLSSALTVSVSGLSGIPATYLALNDVSDASKWPSPTDSTSYSSYRVGSGEIEIFPGSPAFNQAGCKVGSLCPIAITVYGRRASNFTIVVSTGHYPTPLENGVPLASFVPQGAYRYFDFTTLSSLTDVRFIITPESGDPDLVVSLTQQQPTIGCSTADCWIAAGIGPEMITIKSSDPHYQDAPALYNIGVYGWAGNASFTITAVEMTDSYSIDLEDGQPQYQQSEPHAFTYFTYDVPVSALDISPVDFLTTPLQGDVDLFISVSGAYPQVHCVTLDPTAPQGCSEYGVVAGTYAFSSVGSNVADFVTVPVNAQTPGNKIIVGVLATTPDESRFSQLAPPSTFSVVAVSGNGILELQDGLAVVGSVAKSAYKYYSYEISNWGMDLSIVGQATVGSIDLFVSEVAQNPGPSANTWNSTGRGGVNSRDVIYLSALDIASHCPFLIFGIPCTLYIAVKGSDWVNPLLTPAYSLVASLSGNPSFPYYLSSGRSLNTVIQPSSYQYFYSNLNIDQSQSVYLIAQDWSESGTTAMWAALGTTGGAGAFPQPSNNFKADFFSSDLGGFNRIVIAPPTVTADGPVAVPFGNTPEQNEHRRLTVERLASLKDGKAVFKVDAAVARRRLSAATEEDMNSHGRTALWAQRYNPVRARALAAEARALDEASGLVGAAPYCTSCPLYVTLGSRSATQDSDISLYYGAGATFTPLEDDVPFPAIMDGNGTTYFSFAVPDKTADITITVQPFFGSVVAYVIVQSPLRPYRTAASTFWQYKIQPDVGSNSITIPKTDSSFCVSPDGASSGAPCTYTIAVVSVDPTSSFAYFNVLATRDASGSGNVIELLDGEPQDGVVPEGQGLFYQFNPTPYNSNLAVAPVLINAAATVGDITIYVTNSYTPGLSPTTDLPGPTNSRCQWTTKATDPNNILIQSTDPCFNSFAETYTIGIYGSSGIAQFQNKFAVTAAFNQPYLVQKLEFGQPATNQFVADATTRVFVFDLADPTKDISVSVTPTYGDVTLMVAKHSDFANPPICKQAAPGAQAACSGWTWLATGVAGASALSIPAAVPCTPYSGADLQAPLVNQTSCATDYRFGRFWLSVWAWKDAEVSVSVNVGGQPILLTDGEPQMIMTSSVVLCKVRDVNTGLCVPNGQQRFPGQAAFARIVMPAGLSPYDGDLMLERVCNEDQQGNCGQSAVAYINSCSASNCTMADAFPSIYDYDASYTLNNDAAGAINLPMLPAARTVPGDDVVYHVAVYPTCGSGNNNPGVNCQPALLRLTWAGDSQPQRVPVDCNSPGRVCTIPTQDVGNAPNGVRRYIGYAPLNSNGATSTISVTARACMGDVVLSLCNGQAGSKCSPINNPSPSNNDGTASTASVANGVVSLSMTPSAAAQYYFGVSKASGSSFSSPTYNLVLGSAVGPTFVVPGNAPSAIRDTTVGNTVSVAFSLPSLNTNGNPGNANGVVYTAYLFPVTAVPRGYNMGATCGVSAFLATYSNNPASVITYNANSNAFTVKGLTPSQSYMLVITAQCPAGACMPSFLNSQDGVYPSVMIAPFGPAPPSPSPQPNPSSNPNPANPSSSPAPGGSSKGGAIAGGILGTIAALALVGGLFYGYKRWQSTNSTRYSRMGAVNWGGDNTVVNAYAQGRVAGAETGDSTAAYAPL